MRWSGMTLGDFKVAGNRMMVLKFDQDENDAGDGDDRCCKPAKYQALVQELLLEKACKLLHRDPWAGVTSQRLVVWSPL